MLHIPYCVSLTSVSADRPGVRQTEGPAPARYVGLEPATPGPTQAVELRPDTTTVTLKWERRPGAALSYEAAVEAWREEYAARYQEYLNAAKTPVTAEPVPLR